MIFDWEQHLKDIWFCGCYNPPWLLFLIKLLFCNGLFYKICPRFVNSYSSELKSGQKNYLNHQSLHKNLYPVGCVTLCSKSEVLLEWFLIWLVTVKCCRLSSHLKKKDNAFITVWLQIKKLLEYKELEANYWKKGTSSFMVHSKACRIFTSQRKLIFLKQFLICESLIKITHIFCSQKS